MAKGQSLQDPFLNILRKEKVPVSIYLVNGIKLQGQVDSFDQFVVLLKNSVNQMVYKHAISTIVPARNIRLPLPDDEELAISYVLVSHRRSERSGLHQFLEQEVLHVVDAFRISQGLAPVAEMRRQRQLAY